MKIQCQWAIFEHPPTHTHTKCSVSKWETHRTGHQKAQVQDGVHQEVCHRVWLPPLWGSASPSPVKAVSQVVWPVLAPYSGSISEEWKQTLLEFYSNLLNRISWYWTTTKQGEVLSEEDWIYTKSLEHVRLKKTYYTWHIKLLNIITNRIIKYLFNLQITMKKSNNTQNLIGSL